MSNVKLYFDNHTHSHAYHNDPSIYNYIIDHIKKIHKDKEINVLDIGCGDAPFIKNLIANNINAIYYGTDISYNMINMAKKNLLNSNTRLIVSDAFNLPFKLDIQFDIIHLDSVLHHIIGKNKKDSRYLIKKLLDKLITKLSKNG